MVALLKSSASPLTSSFWPHLRGSKVPPEGNMLEQNPFKLHISMHQGWHFCWKLKNLLCEMLGIWQSSCEVMTLNTELLQHCMWRIVIVWEKEEVLESWPLINFVKFQAFDIISFCVCNKNVILNACLYGVWKDFILTCFLLVELWTPSNEAKMRMSQPHLRIWGVSPLDSTGQI